MNSLLHPAIDRLYSQISLENLDEDWILNLNSKINNYPWHLYSEYSTDSWVWIIKSIEWIWIGHKLMIVFLIEMYHLKIETIHLEATPTLTVTNKSVTPHALNSFYSKFWFQVNPIMRDPQYPHKVPMVMNSWEWLKTQVQRYIKKAIPQT